MSQAYSMTFINLILIIVYLCGIAVYSLFLKKRLNLCILLVLISILPIWSIFRAGTYQSGDLTLHSVFLQSFYENLKDGIFIPQWAGGLCGGYGCPVFMFEYISPYYIGSFFHFLGFSYLNSIKLFLASAYILSGITMYVFLKEEVNEKLAFLGSALYQFAPVRFIEMHFIVSVGSDASFIFIPLVFLFAKKSLEGKPLYIIMGAVNIWLLVLSHSSVTFIIIPLSFVYVFIKKNKTKDLLYPVLSTILGCGLSAYYVLPALSQVKYTWYIQTIRSVSEFYPIVYYLFSPTRYGLLFQGSNGELRLIIGYSQILIVIIALYAILTKLFTRTERSIAVFLMVAFLVCFALMLPFSKPLWNSIFFLRSFVLPWRMLIPISFVIGYLGAVVTKNWNKPLLLIFCSFIIGSTILNWGNRQMVPIDQQAYYRQWSLYTEYFQPNNPVYLTRYYKRVSQIPNLVLKRPRAPLQILSGNGLVKELKKTQIDHEYIVYAQSNLLVSENTYYFPGWHVYVNGKLTSVNITNRKKFGTLTFYVPGGLNYVEAKFENTRINKIGNYISFISLLILAVIALVSKQKMLVSALDRLG